MFACVSTCAVTQSTAKTVAGNVVKNILKAISFFRADFFLVQNVSFFFKLAYTF